MIWIDASFAIAWLVDDPRLEAWSDSLTDLAMPGHHYAETLGFFLRKGLDLTRVRSELETVQLVHPDRSHLEEASLLYFQARRSSSCKASLADAILAAMASRERETLLSFDEDFRYLGLVQFEKARWKAASE